MWTGKSENIVEREINEREMKTEGRKEGEREEV